MTNKTYKFNSEFSGTIVLLEGNAKGEYPFSINSEINGDLLTLGAIRVKNAKGKMESVNLKIRISDMPGLAEEIANRQAIQKAKWDAKLPEVDAQCKKEQFMRRNGFSY